MLLGRWYNFDHLEECLTLEELFKIVEAKHKQENREREFLAAVNGATMGEGGSGGEEVPIEEIFKDNSGDITELTGAKAARDGFGIGMGLGLEDHI